jgi:hypothetical protein
VKWRKTCVLCCYICCLNLWCVSVWFISAWVFGLWIYSKIFKVKTLMFFKFVNLPSLQQFLKFASSDMDAADPFQNNLSSGLIRLLWRHICSMTTVHVPLPLHVSPVYHLPPQRTQVLSRSYSPINQDPGCLSGFFPIPDTRSNKKRGGHKFHKIKNYLIFLTDTEEDLSQLTQIWSIFNPKYC